MTYLKDCKDNQFDLAIVDPPYGIRITGDIEITKPSRQKHKAAFLNGARKYKKSSWDNKSPNKEYFIELFRVSINQIIWGANYMNQYLPPSKAWIYWNKGKDYEMSFNFSHGELAFTSFKKQLLSFSVSPKSETRGGKDRVHPTQKPVKLYEWLLMKYAKKGDSILDTHFGSLSIGVACHNLGFDLTACELDKDYFEAGKKRLEQHQKQLRLYG